MKQKFGKYLRINAQITSEKVRVISENGDMIGVVDISKALKLANEAGLDLVEVSPNVDPPVCKIANYGKMKYELQKKASDAKKKQKVVDTKEVKMSVNIGKNDYDFKIRQAIKFVENGDKVKISIRLKGREMSHLDLAYKIFENILQDTEEYAKAELMPKMEGRQMVTVLVKK